jgi:putative transposase
MGEDESCRKGGTVAIRDEVLKALLEGYKRPEDLLGPEGLLKKLTAALVEKALSAEIAEHPGYGKHEAGGRSSGNSRNGTSEKTLKTESGEMPIETPRDRNGSFEPQLVYRCSNQGSAIATVGE